MNSHIMIVFGHPDPKKSRIGSYLFSQVSHIANVSSVNLSEQYPDFVIDVALEQNELLKADLVILQHPFYWYSCPPIMKQWIDEVLTHGFAYGTSGNKLHGKKLATVISCGGSQEAYTPEGHNHYSVENLLVPFVQTAQLCGMQYCQPWVVYNASKISDSQLHNAGQTYRNKVLNFQNNQVWES